MASHNYAALKEHVGHKLECTADEQTVGIDCKTCGETLFEYGRWDDIERIHSGDEDVDMADIIATLPREDEEDDRMSTVTSLNENADAIADVTVPRCATCLRVLDRAGACPNCDWQSNVMGN